MSANPVVKEQYEELPYPHRNPEDERAGLRTTDMDTLDKIRFYGFGGDKDFSNARFLIAGCGTGDSVIYLAYQLQAYPNAKLVALDISDASLNVAKQRAAIRGYDNIEWIQVSLLDVVNMDLEPFDYINCLGVLHHLPDPEEGLAALTNVLKPDGAMGLMVYAQYGRSAIYMMQDLIRGFITPEDTYHSKIRKVRSILKSLGPLHWINRSGLPIANEIASDAGLYDLLLHEQDRAYTVPEFYAFVESAGLQLNHLFTWQNGLGNATYHYPKLVISDPELLEALSKKTKKEQYAIMELWHGVIFKHYCFAARDNLSYPSLDDHTLIPEFAYHITDDILEGFRKNANEEKPRVQFAIPNLDMETLNVDKTPYLGSFLNLIDGQRSIAEIFSAIQKEHDVEQVQLEQEFSILCDAFHIYDWLYLRTADSPEIERFKVIPIPE
jgi:2-polyprenyl-3-methyl-5-hydroxy-6-metoxy-1,4-benzoquinol methylase